MNTHRSLRRTRWLILTAVAFVGICLLVPATASAGRSTPPNHRISITTDGLAGLPETVRPGWHTFEVVNNTAAEAEFNVEMLNDPYGTNDLGALEDASPEHVNEVLDFLGGAALAHGETARFAAELDRGTVVFAAFAAEHDAEYIETATAKGKRTNTQKPDTDVNVRAFDHGFKMPKRIPANAEWRFENTGDEWHVLAICRLQAGKTLADAVSYAETIEPATGAGQGEDPCPPVSGGIATLSSGRVTTATQHLEPGKYVAYCYLPNLSTGTPHYQDGMVKAFTVK